MTPKALKERTEVFADKIIAFCTPLLDDRKTNEMADQLLRSGTAVDSNYGSAQRGRSNDEFIAKLGQVLDDASESRGWLEKLEKSTLVPETDLLKWLLQESDELTRIFAKSYNTARRNRGEKKEEKKRKARRSRRRE